MILQAYMIALYYYVDIASIHDCIVLLRSAYFLHDLKPHEVSPQPAAVKDDPYIMVAAEAASPVVDSKKDIFISMNYSMQSKIIAFTFHTCNFTC